MNVPELTEVGLAMSHASVLLLSVCSFTSEVIQLDFTSHPLRFCIKMLGTKGGVDSNPRHSCLCMKLIFPTVSVIMTLRGGGGLRA